MISRNTSYIIVPLFHQIHVCKHMTIMDTYSCILFPSFSIERYISKTGDINKSHLDTLFSLTIYISKMERSVHHQD